MLLPPKQVLSPTLDMKHEHYLGPGEIILATAEGWEQRKKPYDKMQVCSFLWVYYGYPSSSIMKILM